MRRPLALLVVLSAFASLGAESRTTNFIVHSPDPQVCQAVGQWAEHYRKEKAILWLGHEMPTWPQPCPLYITVTMQPPSGATSFNFGPAGVMGMKMEIQGPLDRLIHSVLPHEVTHTVFAHHFRRPVPRWADEGGSVLSEDDIERERHDKLVRQILNQGQQLPLRTLLNLKEYPPQVMCLYAQGFSMSEFLVGRGDRKTFLAFVGYGMQAGWDQAARTYYGHNSVEELEQAWLQYLRTGRRPQSSQQGTMVAQKGPARPPVGRTMVRLTAPPAQPLEATPVVRGAMPSAEQVGQRFGQDSGGWQPGGVQLGAPVPMPQPAPIPQAAPQAAPRVQLGAPLAGMPRELPQGASPIGFPQ